VDRLLRVAVGGALGSAARYLVSMLTAVWFGSEFPYGTLIVNLAGAFLIGLIQELGTEALLLPDNVRLFLTTGVMGGLTTYSTRDRETPGGRRLAPRMAQRRRHHRCLPGPVLPRHRGRPSSLDPQGVAPCEGSRASRS
jgi:CrcB protein